jgi:tetratricopeptide (TPR) repeat protein
MLLNFLKRFFSKKIRIAFLNARETIGEHKRILVVQHVEQACQSMQETKGEFQDALEQLKTLASISETALDHRYNLLNRQYQFCRAKSENVSNRIKAIETVSEALFLEWEKELNDYTNKTLRNNSKQQLRLAKQNYTRLIKTMKNAESKIQPVLSALKDQVLYIKHNLNARAIAALRHEFIEIGLDISQLIFAMEQTIAEANLYVNAISERKALVKL